MGVDRWDPLCRGAEWSYFVHELWPFQWTREGTALTPQMVDCLYEETQGVIDLAIILYQLTQTEAIRLGRIDI